MASLSPYSITLGATDYPVKYAGLLAYIEPYLTNLETFTFSGGNVGLGVTPSAWANSYKAFTQSSVNTSVYSFWDGTQPMIGMVNGGFVNTAFSWQYSVSGRAVSRYAQEGDGAHKWYTAPSGTAGSAISFFDPKMTLDVSGQLSVGMPLAENSVGVYALPAGEMRVKDSTEDGTSQISIYNINVTNDTEQFFVAMNGGNVDLGNRRTDGVGLKLFTSNTERARITGGGDLLVGTTTLAGAGGISFQSQGGTGFAIIGNNNAAATGYVFASFRRSNTEIGSVTQSGTTAVLFNTTSDRRLKDNITPAPSASAVIDAIEIVSHDWKAAPDEHVTYGVIAQDLALVAPQAVLQGDGGEEVEKTWGVDYSKLVPMLIKEIQSLRARVAALEQT